MDKPQVNTVIVGQGNSASPAGQTKPGLGRRFITKRTVYAFVLLVAVIGAYYMYVLARLGSFSVAPVPSYCPQNIWNEIGNSSYLFAQVYLNPGINTTSLALLGAKVCKSIMVNSTPGFLQNTSSTALIRYNST